MALQFSRSSSQYLYTALSGITERYPATLMCWFKRRDTSTYATESLVSVGDVDNDERFCSIQTKTDRTRGIAFSAYAECGYSITADTTTYHFLAAVFTSNRIYVYFDDVNTNGAWSPSSVTLDQARIGETASLSYSDLANAYIEHVAYWSTNLSASETSVLYDLSSSPLNIQSASLQFYLPLKSNITDSAGLHSFTAVNFSSYTYEDSGISYPSGATTISVSDTGTAVDAIKIFVKTLLAETGSGTDNATNNGKTYLVLSDTLTGVDAVRVFNRFVLGDTGSGADINDGKTYIYDGDTGTGTDDVSVSSGMSTISLSDSATGTDEVILKVFCRVDDSGTESDGDVIKAKVYAPETGSYDDTLTAIKAYLNIGDSGLGDDDLKILAKLILGETGSAADYATKGGNAYVVLSDSGIGVDSISIRALLNLSDSALAVDDDYEKASLTVSESGVAVDSIGIKALLALLDSGITSDDVLKGDYQKIISDNGTFIDSITVVGNGGIVEDIYFSSPIKKTLNYKSIITKTLSYTAVLQ